MACFKITITVTDTVCGGESGCSWKYIFYTRLNPEAGDPETEGLTPEQTTAERDLRNLIVVDPLRILRDPFVPSNRKTRTMSKSCKINVKEYASNGSWRVSFDKNSDNQEAYKRVSVPYKDKDAPPWGNVEKTIIYSQSYESVEDGSCDQDFTTEAIDDFGDSYEQGPTECECPFGDSGVADFSGGGFGGLSQSFNAQNTPTMEDFIDYIEGLQSSCLSNGGVSFTLQFSCLPKNIVLEPFSFPSGWNSFSDAQKINFLNSKVTLLQQALGNSYYQEISLKTNCLKSSGTIINGHIYKQ
jgi:hypothetical protein